MDHLDNDRMSDTGMTGNTSSNSITGDWDNDQSWWRENFQDRPYASADRQFEDYEPGYRFGYDSASRYSGKSWNDAEPNLRADWDKYEHRNESTWESIKDSVHDAWDNLTGKY